jgi:hypothetical protein
VESPWLVDDVVVDSVVVSSEAAVDSFTDSFVDSDDVDSATSLTAKYEKPGVSAVSWTVVAVSLATVVSSRDQLPFASRVTARVELLPLYWLLLTFSCIVAGVSAASVGTVMFETYRGVPGGDVRSSGTRSCVRTSTEPVTSGVEN